MSFNKINHAVIMAAGRGLRMMPLTKELPKPMIPLLNSTIIAQGIKKLKKQVKNIHITVGYKGEMLASHVINQNVTSVINSKNKSNTWWIYNSLLSLIDEPIIVLTCDNIVDVNFNSFIDEFINKNYESCMLVPAKPVKNIKGDYIEHNSKKQILNITREKKTKLYASGIQVLNPYRLNRIAKKKNFNELWNSLIKTKQLYISQQILSNWYSIDTIDNLNYFKKHN